VTYLDNDINLNDVNQPFRPFLGNKNLPISTSLFKNYFREIKEIRINSDKNLFFESFEETKNFKFSNLRESVDMRKDHSLFPGTFSQMTFITSGDTHIYFRKYKKLFEVIILIGGFCNGLFSVAYIILFLYSNNMILWSCISSIISKDEINVRLDKKFKINKQKEKSYKSEIILNKRINEDNNDKQNNNNNSNNIVNNNSNINLNLNNNNNNNNHNSNSNNKIIQKENPIKNRRAFNSIK